MHRIRPGAALLLATLLTAAFAAPSHASPGDEALAADELVSAVYYEGLPYDRARAITSAGAAHLIDLLDDPSRLREHANALLVLGICGHPGAYEAILGYAGRRSSGEVDGASYRARRAVLLAMGHLANTDDRALSWLEARVRAATTDPGWSRGAMRGLRLARAQRHAAIQALGVAARPEADAILGDLLQRVRASKLRAASVPDAQLADQAAEALALARRIRVDGRSAVMSPGAGGGR